MQPPRIINVVLSLLIYLPTIAYVPIWIFLIGAALGIFFNLDFLKSFFKNLFNFKISDKNFALILLCAVTVGIMRLIDSFDDFSLSGLYSFVYLFPLTYILAKEVFKRPVIYKYIILFILIEAFVSIIEYCLGVNTIFSGIKNYIVFENFDLLYFTRVFGLSTNSSIFALKLFFGILFLPLIKMDNRAKLGIEFVLAIASILAFGRIVLIGLIIYYCLKLFKLAMQEKAKVFGNSAIIVPLLLFTFFAVNPNWTKRQFTRNNIVVNIENRTIPAQGDIEEGENVDDIAVRAEMEMYTSELGLDKVDLSGRNFIWNVFIGYSLENLVFGNMGKKLMFGKYHAHNSFLQVLSSCGIVFFAFLMLIIAININRENVLYIIPVLIMGMGQYLIFWGISFFDILFYSVLFFLKPKKTE